MKFRIIFFILLFEQISLGQSLDVNSFHPYSNRMIISSDVGFTHSYSDYTYGKPEIIGRASIEYYFRSKSTNAFGIKVLTGISKIAAEGKEIDQIPVNVNYRTDLFFLGTGFTFAKKWGYGVLNISATISHLRFNPKDQNGDILPNNRIRKYGLDKLMYSAEVGFRFIVNDFWSLNLGINYNVTNSDYLDDIKINENNDSFISAFTGISIFHGGDTDSDNDGIRDNRDACPSTPEGVAVDSFGCPFDTDKDGVPDYLDECPGTPRNIIITEFGCPEYITETVITDSVEVIPDSSSIIKSDSVIADTFKVIKSEPLVADTSLAAEVEPTEDTFLFTDTIVFNTSGSEVDYNFGKEKNLGNFIFTDGKLYWFQTAAFKTFEASKEVADKLFKEGHNAFVIKAFPFKDERVWYRIRIGIFTSLGEVKDYQSNFK